MKVKFLRKVQYETEGRGKGPIYEKDSIHDFDEEHAQKWLRRGVAEEVGKPLMTSAAKPAATLTLKT